MKLGIVDFDTSHVVQFSKRFNKKGIEQDQWVDGAEVVLGCPGTSRMSPERVPGFTKTLVEECGVKLVDKPEDMLGKIDGVMIESVEGNVHLERAKPFLEAGVPTWIDKPLACSVKEAEAIVKLAAKKNVPLFSASSLRYALEVKECKAAREELGPPVAVHVFGVHAPSEFNVGWYNYGIHAVELLFGLLGPGFEKPKYVECGNGYQSMGGWKGNVLGSITLVSKGDSPFGFTYFGEKKTRTARVNMGFVYREMLKEMVTFFKTGKAPVPIEETLELIRYIETVNKLAAVKK